VGRYKVNCQARINGLAVLVAQLNQSSFARLQPCVGNGKGKLLQALTKKLQLGLVIAA
jgi:hypothetical protein